MSWIVCVSIPYSEVTYSMRSSMRLHSLLVISIFIATLTGAFVIVRINRERVKAVEKSIHLETQRHLEKEILQTKDYLENILESTESKIMVLDSDLKIKTVNSAHEHSYPTKATSSDSTGHPLSGLLKSSSRYTRVMQCAFDQGPAS